MSWESITNVFKDCKFWYWSQPCMIVLEVLLKMNLKIRDLFLQSKVLATWSWSPNLWTENQKNLAFSKKKTTQRSTNWRQIYFGNRTFNRMLLRLHFQKKSFLLFPSFNSVVSINFAVVQTEVWNHWSIPWFSNFFQFISPGILQLHAYFWRETIKIWDTFQRTRNWKKNEMQQFCLVSVSSPPKNYWITFTTHLSHLYDYCCNAAT